MTPAAAVWVASAVGAMLFFVAGALSARARRGRAAVLEDERQPAPPPEAGEDLEREALRRARDSLAEEARALRQRVDTAERRLGQAEALERENESLRQSLARAERTAARESERRGALERQLDGERAQWRQREAEKEHEREREVERDRERQGERERELSLELEVLERRLKGMVELEQENARLRGEADERELLRRKVEELSKEAASLRAAGLARAKGPPLGTTPHRGPRATEARLQALLQGIAASSGMRTAVLGDELGLPIAGIGEHVGPLAAFGGFIDSIASKARDFLPMDGLRRVAVEDEHGAAVSAFPLTLGDSRIVLATLTVGTVPPTAKMTELVRSAASMVQ